MEDLSLHIMDIMENSIRAGARNILLRFTEDAARDDLVLEIEDDGKGMDEGTKRNALNPFFTTKEKKRFGLGLSLLSQAAQETGGGLRIESQPGKGTRIVATFHPSHIDMKPMGDINQTLRVLQLTHPDIHFRFDYVEKKGG